MLLLLPVLVLVVVGPFKETISSALRSSFAIACPIIQDPVYQ